MSYIKIIAEDQRKSKIQIKDIFKNEGFKVEDIDNRKHTILFRVCDETIDRVGERMIVAGCNFKNYNKTGKPFLWCHNRRVDNPPLGRGVWTKIINNELKILTEFWVNKGNAWSDFCTTIYEMYRDDFMQCVSISFIPDKRREPTIKEKQEDPKLSLITEKWELLEHSAVPVPANPNAVQEKILQEKLQEVKEAMNNNRIIIPSVCLEDFGFKKKSNSEIGTIKLKDSPMLLLSNKIIRLKDNIKIKKE